MNVVDPRNAGLIGSIILIISPAWAQADDPVKAAPVGISGAAGAAVDAFGERVGIDQVGLYSEYQTRGFDLNATSGAFRLDGFYFNPAAFPSESLIEGSSVNVGIAATALDLPSPTGVVTYRLREPGETNSLQLTGGIRDEDTLYGEVRGTLVSDDGHLGLVGQTSIAPNEGRTTGEEGLTVTAGLVGRWRPTTRTNVRLFASYGFDHHDGGISVLAAGAGITPALKPHFKYSPSWARSRSDGGNFGLLAEHRWGRWSAGLSLIRSTSNTDRNDVAVLEIDREGNAASTLYYTPPVTARSDSAEAKLSRDFALFGAQHRIGLAVRQRHSVTGRAQATGFEAGHFTVEAGPAELAASALPAIAIRGRDVVDQRIVSLSYGLQVSDHFQLRMGAHSNHYEKVVDAFDGARARQRDQTWLYSASGVWQPDERFRLFASYVSGLEESGVAPAAALNRGEVLPPVKARQLEFGARYRIAANLNLIVAGFDIRKPIYGLRPDTLFAPVGTVRHRGIEASLTGRLTADTTIVLGANIVSPRVSGELVDAGLVRRTAPGVSKFNATLSIEQQLTPSWSIDGYLLYEGKRKRDGISDTDVPAVPFAFAGTRYAWTWGKTAMSLRAQLVNVLGYRGYYATSYGPLVPVSPQTYRLLLTVGL
ncbi:MAG TPA: TonB-dependent receptor [Sphingomonas sp.]|nr:TonB-dependent receptor [Sphingomonas sp.]